MKITHTLSQLRAVDQQQTLANGAILVDDFDRMIFDEVLRRYPMWNVIEKRLAPGDFTNGFDQTAVAAARAANKRSMAYSATSPTRVARTPQEVKAIVNDLTLGMYDRSVYQQQGRRFGDLTAKDVRDAIVSCLREWARQFHLGDDDSDALEYNGWREQLSNSEALVTVAQETSVVKTIQERIVTMMNSTARDVRPTFINCNARVRQIIAQELRLAGDKLIIESLPGVGERVPFLDTAAGSLPLIVDPWNTVLTGDSAVDKYPTLIGSGDYISWQYVEPLGESGAEPKTFEIVMNNVLDSQFKTVMFGTLEMLGGTNHHKRLDIEDRSVVVNPTS